MSTEPEQQPIADREAHFLPLDRFNAFSDGVFAIAITLLVLEIAIPHAGESVLPALREQWPEFLGYFISFAFIGGIWISHSGVTKFMKHGDAESFTLNLLLLLLVGLLPFSTALMVTHLNGADAEVSVLLYGVNLLLASLVLSLLIRYLSREPSLLVDADRRRHPAAHHPAALDRARAEPARDRRGAHRPEGRGRPLPRRDHAAPDHPVPRSAPASASAETSRKRRSEQVIEEHPKG